MILMYSEYSQNHTDFLVPSLLCTSQFGLKEMHLKANGPLGYEILLSF